MQVNEYQIMAEENPGSPRNRDAMASTAADIFVGSLNDAGDEKVPRASASVSAVGGSGDRERD